MLVATHRQRSTHMSKVATVSLRLLSCLLGLIIVAVGWLIAQSSYQVSFQQVSDAALQHYVSGNADNGHTSYFTVAGSTAIFIVHENDFSPAVTFDSLGQGNISYFYDPNNTTDVDVSATNGLHLKGTGYPVVQITALDTNKSFTTKDYASHPNGYYTDRHLIGYIVLTLGGIITLLSLFIGEHMVKSTAAGALGVPLVVFLFIGFFVGPGAIATDLEIAIVLGLIGAVGGLLFGIYNGFQARAEAQRNKPMLQREAQDKRKEDIEITAAKTQLAGRSSPNTYVEWNERAGLLLKAKRYSEALTAQERALALAPQGEPQWVFRNNLAAILNLLGRHQEALDNCDLVLKQQPAYMPTIRERGYALLSLGRYSEAIEMYDRALAATPNDVTLLNNKSAALGNLGRKKEGLQICEQVLKLDPTNPVATKNRAAFRS